MPDPQSDPIPNLDTTALPLSLILSSPPTPPDITSPGIILAEALARLLRTRSHPKTICPSEGPRALSSSELAALGVSDWRDLMPLARWMLWDARERGEVEILQRGLVIPEDVVGLEDLRGPIRARLRKRD